MPLHAVLAFQGEIILEDVSLCGGYIHDVCAGTTRSTGRGLFFGVSNKGADDFWLEYDDKPDSDSTSAEDDGMTEEKHIHNKYKWIQFFDIFAP